MTCTNAWLDMKSHLHFYLHGFFFASLYDCKLFTIFYTTPSSGLGDKKLMEIWIEGREEKSTVFKSLLETELGKSAI